MTEYTIPVFDGHNDSLQSQYMTETPKRSLLEESRAGHIDLPRARRGGFAGGFFAIFIPSPNAPHDDDTAEQHSTTPLFIDAMLEPIDQGYAQTMTHKGVQSLLRLERESAGTMTVVRSVREVDSALEKNILAAVMHFEGAEAIDADLRNLDEWYAAGLRSLGIVWSRPNAFGTGVDFRGASPDQGPGLSAAGKELVRRCNRMGILVDVSHLNAAGFRDVAAISDKPIVASHSNAFSLCPSPRNLTDEQLDAIKASGGIVGINFCVAFLRRDMERNADTPLELMVAHFRYIAERIGADHLGFGSDFDGALIPQSVGDVTGLPRVLAALQENGFTQTELEKIAYKNWMRILKTTWKI